MTTLVSLLIFSYLLFIYYSFLFARPKRNEAKKKDAGNENYSFFWQNAFGFTLPKKAVVRAISGLATARYSPIIQIRQNVSHSPKQDIYKNIRI
jgi:hypothetical protein